jgi:predicted transposase YdaD
MQPDTDFYGRYFAEIYLYLKQYKIIRPWRGLLILKSRRHDLSFRNPLPIPVR